MAKVLMSSLKRDFGINAEGKERIKKEAEVATLQQLIGDKRKELSALITKRNKLAQGMKRHRATYDEIQDCRAKVLDVCNVPRAMSDLFDLLNGLHQESTIRGVVKNLREDNKLVMIGERSQAMYINPAYITEVFRELVGGD